MRRPHAQTICHLGDGRWYDLETSFWRNGNGRKLRTNLPAPDVLPAEFATRFTRVSLACAHLDHHFPNNEAANLAALCQLCHMIHDGPHHLARWRITYLMRRTIGDLLSGRYRQLV
ncbi:hypothetical protein U0C82_07370 [Fulvimarina sp. 2208YS6-2-32]|uniref:HNH endonuclease n=1 Tax=Fulvimarina uroteuthidis TaxID=3098149 RepID=A0ABU5I1U7_9HYPH|nr:hypothetical protein [Fulvimarina sp. 2208YS6-2-32]MDY8108963.1 hypothetical protein [Fulvimarina sp. 2208YS6-2-32]